MRTARAGDHGAERVFCSCSAGVSCGLCSQIDSQSSSVQPSDIIPVLISVTLNRSPRRHRRRCRSRRHSLLCRIVIIARVLAQTTRELLLVQAEAVSETRRRRWQRRRWRRRRRRRRWRDQLGRKPLINATVYQRRPWQSSCGGGGVCTYESCSGTSAASSFNGCAWSWAFAACSARSFPAFAPSFASFTCIILAFTSA